MLIFTIKEIGILYSVWQIETKTKRGEIKLGKGTLLRMRTLKWKPLSTWDQAGPQTTTLLSVMLRTRLTASFTKDTEHVSTRASIRGKGIMTWSYYSVKLWGQWRERRKWKKLNALDCPFCFPVARLNTEMESEESNDPNIKPKNPNPNPWNATSVSPAV